MSLSQDPFDDSLLSAYLDNEVSDTQRVLVESKIAADPAVRDLLNELKSIRDLVAQSNLMTNVSERTESKIVGPWLPSVSSRIEQHGLEPSAISPAVLPPASKAVWRIESWRWIASLAAGIAILATCGYLWNQGNQAGNRRLGHLETATKNTISPPPSKAIESNSLPESERPAAAYSAMDNAIASPATTASLSNSPTDQPMSMPMSFAEDSRAGGFASNFSLSQNGTEVPPPAGDSEASSKQELGDDSALEMVISNTMIANDEIALQTAPQLWAYQNDPRQVIPDFVPVPPLENMLAERTVDQPTDSAAGQTANQLAEASGGTDNGPQVEIPVVIELQVLKENWSEGANRMRRLGIPVPDELPTDEVVEYEVASRADLGRQMENMNRQLGAPLAEARSYGKANQNIANNGLRGSQNGRASREQVLAWRYQSKNSGTDEKKDKAKSQKEAAPSYIRIRLKILK